MGFQKTSDRYIALDCSVDPPSMARCVLLAMDQGFLTRAVLPPQCAMEDFGGGGGGGGWVHKVKGGRRGEVCIICVVASLGYVQFIEKNRPLLSLCSNCSL